MKRKNVIILAGMMLAFVFLTGCGVSGTDYLTQSNNDSNTGGTGSKTEEQLQNEIDALQKEIDALKKAQNSGQDSGTASDNTQTGNNSQSAGNSGTGGNTGIGGADVQISLEEATQIALERVPGATEQNISIHLDFDDGWYIYEGDIIYNRMEYEFDIDANTGTILKWEQERW